MSPGGWVNGKRVTHVEDTLQIRRLEVAMHVGFGDWGRDEEQ